MRTIKHEFLNLAVALKNTSFLYIALQIWQTSSLSVISVRLPSFSLVFGIGGPWDDADILPQLIKSSNLILPSFEESQVVPWMHSSVTSANFPEACRCTAQRNKICPAVLPCHSLTLRPAQHFGDR